MISNFSELFTELKEKGICRKLVVAWGVDEHSIEASYRAVEMGFVQAILVGDRARIEKVCAEKGFEIGKFTIVDEPVELKVAITKFLINTAHSFGIAMPKVAFIAASEQMMDTMPACVEGAMLSVMASRGQLGACIGDGPLALDVAVDKESADIKGLKSEVAGDADCLLFPNIESANVFWKTNSKLCKDVKQGGMLVGTTAPCLLVSRADSAETKLNSIAAAVMCAK